MQEQLKTIRDAAWVLREHNRLHFGSDHNTIAEADKISAALTQLETMAGEPWLDERGYTLAPLHTAAPVAQQQRDDYKAWYDEAMCASNEAGFVGLSAAQTIKALSDEVAELKHTQAEPVHWRAVLDPEQVPQQLKTTMHVVGFREKKAAEGFMAEQIDFYGWRYTIEPLYAAPVAQQPQAECRSDGRCQYAIDSGAEGLGHCPKGKCVMQQSHAKTAEVFRCKTCGCTMQMPHDDCLACERGAPQQAEAVQACGHPMSLLLRSAESNEPLYCEACDDKSGRHDAERRETELLDANRHLQEKIGSADALKLHAIEELCQLGYTVKEGELIPPDHLHKLVEAAGHPLAAPQQAEAVQYTRADLDRAYSAGLVEGERLAIQQAEAVPSDVVRDAAPIPDHELVTMYDERPTSDLEMIEFAREVERRHGIGVQPQHITDGSPCWCNPDVAYTDPETGASVIVHRRPQ